MDLLDKVVYMLYAVISIHRGNAQPNGYHSLTNAVKGCLDIKIINVVRRFHKTWVFVG